MTSLVLRNYATLFVPGSGLVSGACIWCSRDEMVSKFITFMRDITVPSFWGPLLCSLKKGHGVMMLIYFEGYCCPSMMRILMWEVLAPKRRHVELFIYLLT